MINENKMSLRCYVALLVVWGLSSCVQRAYCDIIPIGPFIGDRSDGFDHFTTNDAVQSLDVFGGFGTLTNLSSGGAVKVEFNSQLNGDWVIPRSGMMIGQLGRGRWDFQEPVVQFGGYFENNSGADDATLLFYDENLSLIDSVVADVPEDAGQWTWNGWQSDTPFQRVEVVGNGIIEGFIWYEDIQVMMVPEPVSGVFLVVAALMYPRRGH